MSDFLSKEDGIDFSLITDRAAYVGLKRALQVSQTQKVNSIQVYRMGPNFPSILRHAYYRTLHRYFMSLDNLLLRNLYNEAVSIPEMKNVDIFHIHGFWQPLYPTIGQLLSEHFHRPFIVTLHGDSIDPKDPFSMPLRKTATLSVLRKATAITTFAKETLNLLNTLGLGEKSKLIPNFIDTQRFQRPFRSKNASGTRVVMITRLSKPKDPITPIRAFALIKKRFPQATLKIVGYGSLYPYAKRLIQNLGLNSSVDLVGMKSDVREFLWDSDIFLSTRGSYLTTLEARAAGLVVIAPDFGILKEIISNGQTGFLTEPGNADELASVIENLMENSKLRTEIVENGIKAAKEYDIRTVAPILKNIYKSSSNL